MKPSRKHVYLLGYLLCPISHFFFSLLPTVSNNSVQNNLQNHQKVNFTLKLYSLNMFCYFILCCYCLVCLTPFPLYSSSCKLQQQQKSTCRSKSLCVIFIIKKSLLLFIIWLFHSFVMILYHKVFDRLTIGYTNIFPNKWTNLDYMNKIPIYHYVGWSALVMLTITFSKYIVFWNR
jgi:hypothetical protein